jgi:hypothetical protein
MRVIGRGLTAARFVCACRLGATFAVGCSIVGLMATLNLSLTVGQAIVRE